MEGHAGGVDKRSHGVAFAGLPGLRGGMVANLGRIGCGGPDRGDDVCNVYLRVKSPPLVQVTAC